VGEFGNSLMPAAAGLLGALIGGAASLFASTRAIRASFEQVHYAQLQQRRYDASAALYGMLNRIQAYFKGWLPTSMGRRQTIQLPLLHKSIGRQCSTLR
jgi:hypothetical protein